jgi:hypothetical protein
VAKVILDKNPDLLTFCDPRVNIVRIYYTHDQLIKFSVTPVILISCKTLLPLVVIFLQIYQCQLSDLHEIVYTIFLFIQPLRKIQQNCMMPRDR